MNDNQLYIPKTDYEYPFSTFEHMIKVKKVNSPVLDKNYIYRDKSKKFAFKQFWFRLFLDVLVLPITRIRYGLRIEGKENLRRNKEKLSRGAVSVCNHVFYWDYLVVQAGLWPVKTEVPLWKRNNEGPLASIMRLAGSIPVPEMLSGLRKFYSALDDAIDEHKTVHFYAEASMWFYFAPIRPFKKGAFALAQKHGVPVIPLAISYRKPTGLYKLFKKNEPNVTLHIGEPQTASTLLPPPLAVDELCDRVRGMMIRMVGIANEEENDKLINDYPRCAQNETVLY